VPFTGAESPDPGRLVTVTNGPAAPIATTRDPDGTMSAGPAQRGAPLLASNARTERSQPATRVEPAAPMVNGALAPAVQTTLAKPSRKVGWTSLSGIDQRTLPGVVHGLDEQAGGGA